MTTTTPITKSLKSTSNITGTVAQRSSSDTNAPIRGYIPSSTSNPTKGYTLSDSKPWAVSILFQTPPNYSSAASTFRTLWAQSEGSSVSSDGVYLGQGQNGNLLFYSTTSSSNYIKFASNFNLSPSTYYSVYVDYNGARKGGSTSSSTRNSYFGRYRIGIVNLVTREVNWLTEGDGSSTQSTYSATGGSWTASGTGHTTAHNGVFYVGSINGNNKWGGLFNSSSAFITHITATTLRANAQLPVDDEVAEMTLDPQGWANSYKVGNAYRLPGSTTSTSNFQKNNSSSTQATKMYLMGDGASDSGTWIYNDIYRTDTNTAHRLDRNSGSHSYSDVRTATGFPSNYNEGLSNSPPIVVSNTISFGSNTYTFANGDFVYSDPDGDPISALEIVTVPATGTLAIGANTITDGTQVSFAAIDNSEVTYTAAANGSTSLVYRVSDGTDTSSDATITLDATNVGPVIIPGSDSATNNPVTTTVDYMTFNGSNSRLQQNHGTTTAFNSIYSNGTDSGSDPDIGKSRRYGWFSSIMFRVSDPGSSGALNLWNKHDGTTHNVMQTLDITRDTSSGAYDIYFTIAVQNSLVTKLTSYRSDAEIEIGKWYSVFLDYNGGNFTASSGISTTDARFGRYRIILTDVETGTTTTLTEGVGTGSVQNDYNASSGDWSQLGGTPPQNIAGNFHVGAMRGNSRFFKGDIAHVALGTYDDGVNLLSDAQVKNISVDPDSWFDNYRLGETVRESNSLTTTYTQSTQGNDDIQGTQYWDFSENVTSTYIRSNIKSNGTGGNPTDPHALYINGTIVTGSVGIDNLLNSEPQAQDNYANVFIGQTSTINASAFPFTDSDSDDLSFVTIVQAPSSGTLLLGNSAIVDGSTISNTSLSNGNVTYTPPNSVSNTPLIFTVSDGKQSSSNATLTFRSLLSNESPYANSFTIQTLFNNTYVFTANDFNYGDSDGDELSHILVTQSPNDPYTGIGLPPPATGTLRLGSNTVLANTQVSRLAISNGLFTFTPALDKLGTPLDTFDYKVHDGTEISTNTYIMSLNVIEPNQPPSGADYNRILTGTNTHTLTYGNLSYDDDNGVTSDIMSHANVITAAPGFSVAGVPVANGDLIPRFRFVNSEVTFVASANQVGTTQSMTYKLNDGELDSTNTYTYSIEINPANQEPFGANSTIDVEYDEPYTFSNADIGYYDKDANGTFTSIRIVETILSGNGDLTLGGVSVESNTTIEANSIDTLAFTSTVDTSGNNYNFFTFKTSDGIDESIDTYTISLNVKDITTTIEPSANTDTPTSVSNNITQPYHLSIAANGEIIFFWQPEAPEIDPNETYYISYRDPLYGQFNLEFKGEDLHGSPNNAQTILLGNGTIIGPVQTWTLLGEKDTANTEANTGGYIDLSQPKITEANTFGNTFITGGHGVNGNSTVSPFSNSNFVATGTSNTESIAPRPTYIEVIRDESANVIVRFYWNLDSTTTPPLLPNNLYNFEYTSDTYGLLHYQFYGNSEYQTAFVGDANYANSSTNSSVIVTPSGNLTNWSVWQFHKEWPDGSTNNMVELGYPLTTTSPTFNAIGFGGGNTSGGNTSIDQYSNSGVGSFGTQNEYEANTGRPYSNTATFEVNQSNTFVFATNTFPYVDAANVSSNLHSIKVVEVNEMDDGVLLLANVEVVNNDVIAANSIANGQLVFAASNTATIQSNTFIFSFKVSDGETLSTVAYDTIANITPLITPSSANGYANLYQGNTYTFAFDDIAYQDTSNTRSNTLVSMTIESVLANTGLLTLEGANVVNGAIVSANALSNGSLVYQSDLDTPVGNLDVFGFTVSDGSYSSTNTYSYVLNILEAIRPSGANSSANVFQGNTYTFANSDFPFIDSANLAANVIQGILIDTALANTERGLLELEGSNVVSNTVVSSNALSNGSLTFTANLNAEIGNAYNTFTFKTFDGRLYSNDAFTFTINIEDTLNPLSSNTSANIMQGDTLVFATNNFPYVDAGNVSSNLVSITVAETLANTERGLLELNGYNVASNTVISANSIANGELTFTANLYAEVGNGYNTFTFFVNDGVQNSDNAYVFTINMEDRLEPLSSNTSANVLQGDTFVFATNTFPYIDAGNTSSNLVSITVVDTLANTERGLFELDGSNVVSNTVISANSIANGSLTFTANLYAEVGNAYNTFTYTVNDGVLDSINAYTFTFNMEDRLEPLSSNTSANVLQGDTFVFSNSTFPYIDAGNTGSNLVSITVVTSLANTERGLFELNGSNVVSNTVISANSIANGSLTFAANLYAEVGNDYNSFTYTVNDGVLDSINAYSFTFNIEDRLEPLSSNTSANVFQGNAFTFGTNTFPYIDAGNTGTNLHSIRIVTALANTERGLLELNGSNVVANTVVSANSIANGELVFTANLNANVGNSYNSFTYRVSDGLLESINAYSFTINIEDTIEPSGANGSANVIIGRNKVFAGTDFPFVDIANVSANVIQGIEIVTSANTNGLLTFVGANVVNSTIVSAANLANGDLVFTSANTDPIGNNFNEFTFKVFDGVTYSNTESAFTYTINIIDIPAPEAANGTVIARKGNTYTFQTTDFGYIDAGEVSEYLVNVNIITTTSGANTLFTLANTIVTDNTFVTAQQIEDGELVYRTPNSAPSGVYDSFTYKVSDGNKYSINTYSIDISLSGANTQVSRPLVVVANTVGNVETVLTTMNAVVGFANGIVSNTDISLKIDTEEELVVNGEVKVIPPAIQDTVPIPAEPSNFDKAPAILVLTSDEPAEVALTDNDGEQYASIVVPPNATITIRKPPTWQVKTEDDAFATKVADGKGFKSDGVR